MKITVWTWKDERWSASKEDLQAINNLINREKKVKNGDKFFYILGWIIMTPFWLLELTKQGIKWAKRKIKK